MRSLFGGKLLHLVLFTGLSTDQQHSITKLMGEAFKLHAQALSGYEDAVNSGSAASTPTMSSQGVDLEIDASFQAIHS